MTFGRNPHVAKAEAAEQKAGDATDDHSRERAWREAAHLWGRAAERETDARRCAQYTARAEAARAKADGEGQKEIRTVRHRSAAPAPTPSRPAR